MIKGLYVHIPFCAHTCGYCDFAKAKYNSGLANRYLNELEKEICAIGQKEFETVYVGGGTPTSLSSEQLDRLLSFLSGFGGKKEFTVEINPETFDLEKAMIMKKHGVNRVSIGIQSFNERLLNEMDRSHNNEDTFNTLKYLDEAGIKNRSIDLMYGFNSQSLEDLESDLEKAVNLDVTHISIYELEVHEKTMFGINNYQLADEETRYLMYRKIIEYLNAHSYKQYEVSNFALPYSQSQHNLIYWHYEDYYGAGLAACGKIGNERYENTHNFMDYLNGNYRLEVNKLSLEEVRFEAIMMGLRLVEGINIERYNEKHGCQLLKHYDKAIEKNVNKGLLRIDNGCLKTTSMGMMVLNDILVDFMNWL